jgi:L-2-hydroxyglutarate oxidase LhgO
VTDLKFLSAKAVSTEEPELSAAEVLYSPSTGVLDTHAYMQSLVADIETAGGLIVYKTACLGAEIAQNGFQINIGGTDPTLVRSKYLINAAGLNAIPFAEKIKGLSKNTVPQACFAKGNYYTYLGKVPFVRLIYPVPEVGGLGIHLTIDINGQARFGPDVEWVSHIDYQVNDKSKQEFARAIQTYWPSCDAKKLMPAYSGIRPKIGIPEQFSKDFVIQTEIDHGVAGLINLYGIESPGLTASLAIAEQVFSFIKEVRN